MMDERDAYIEFITKLLQRMDLRRIRLIYELVLGISQ